MAQIDLFLMKAGYCDAHENFAIRNGRRKKINFDATFGLIKHPEKGIILFDTGYTRRFHEETRHFPEKIYALITKVYIRKNEEAIHQLQKLRIHPSEIKHIIVSHFHADHIGGIRDFPEATFYCSAKAYNEIKQKEGFSAVKKGLLKGLIPDDFDSRVSLVENCNKIPDSIFENVYDLFNDGLI